VVVERDFSVVRLEVDDAARDEDGLELLHNDVEFGVGVGRALVLVDGAEGSLKLS